MAYISKSQVKTIIEGAPKGTSPETIVQGLLANGHTLEGYGNSEIVALAQKPDALSRASNIINKIFPGERVGQAIGTLAGLGISKARGTSEFYDSSAPSIAQTIGDVLSGTAFVGGLKAPVPRGFLKQAGQFAGLSGATALGQGLSQKKSVSEIAKDTATAGAIGFGVGGVFNLLGRGISTLARKSAPPTLSFTSGVPKKAIEQAIQSPESARVGRTSTNASELQQKAIQALKNPKQGLYRVLSDEFSSGLDKVTNQYGYGGKLGKTAQVGSFKYEGGGVNLPALNRARKLAEKGNALNPKIANQVKSLINDFRLTSKEGAIDFSKSSITKGAEQANIQEAFNTVKNWSDYTPSGLQTLAERMAGLRNFDTPAGTKQSAILGRIYNKIAGNKGIIETHYPELKALRDNFSKTTRVLDEINSVVGGDARNIKGTQAAVNRLSGLFREDKELYINAIRELSQRSGVDILGLLAGTEFQKVLPGFVRGLGGGGAVSVGAALFNPWLILLAPLFSPRFAGKLVETAPKIAGAADKLIRAGVTQAVGQR